jgi:hypothetical protein
MRKGSNLVVDDVHKPRAKGTSDSVRQEHGWKSESDDAHGATPKHSVVSSVRQSGAI